MCEKTNIFSLFFPGKQWPQPQRPPRPPPPPRPPRRSLHRDSISGPKEEDGFVVSAGLEGEDGMAVPPSLGVLRLGLTGLPSVLHLQVEKR